MIFPANEYNLSRCPSSSLLVFANIQAGRKIKYQIVSHNFQKWTARIKIKTDLDGTRLNLKHIKQQIVWKSMNGKNQGLLNRSSEVRVHIFKHTLLKRLQLRRCIRNEARKSLTLSNDFIIVYWLIL